MGAWTQENKDAIVEAYEAEEPTIENTEEIVQMIAEDSAEDEDLYGEVRTVNAVRRILSNAKVYVKKEVPKAKEKEKKARVTPKAKALARFAAVCELNEVEFALDEDDTKKMTAKVLEAVIGIFGQVGEALPEEEDE